MAFIGIVILMLIKFLIYVKDLKEFRKFENEKKKSKWAEVRSLIWMHLNYIISTHRNIRNNLSGPNSKKLKQLSLGWIMWYFSAQATEIAICWNEAKETKLKLHINWKFWFNLVTLSFLKIGYTNAAQLFLQKSLLDLKFTTMDIWPFFKIHFKTVMVIRLL